MSYKMTRSAPYKLFRGRKIKDADWNKLVETPLDFIEDDSDAGVALVNAGTPRGCFLTQGGKEQSAKHWRCHFYVAKEQRVIGRGSVCQCAKLYDYALLYFEKYRARKTGCYNFSKLDAESDMNFEPAIGQYLAELERYLLEKAVLAIPVKKCKSETAKEKQRAREHKHTIAGTIESWMEEFQPHIFDIAAQNEGLAVGLHETAARLTAAESSLAEINKKLDSVLKLVNIPPA